ncbi:MAG TPA: tyrosine-type recombinase/integrase [Streptosporangiaceae bacterium]|nr:tyrosine-type recombinase/integrase [Streptosporangiaceae bacterium]
MLQLRPEDAMFEAMLRGWKAQQVSRGLRVDTIAPRERLVRRFLEFTNEYPWSWGPSHVDEWTQTLTSERRLAPSTIRGYQMDLRLFSEYLCDGRYGWAAACEKEFGPGSHPVPVCHEWNTIAHLYGYEGNPEARPFTREELQRFLDYADDQVDRAVASKRKGALAAYRDATMFKVIYGWGLRRTETSKLDVADWGRNASAPEFGKYGMLHVRYGKAKRGQPPRRRNVASVMGWAVDAVADYAENVRPRFGFGDHPALWVTERGGRVKPAEINARFESYREALRLPAALSPHSLRLRHSFGTVLINRDVPQHVVQKILDHDSPLMTAHYARLSDKTVREHWERARKVNAEGQPVQISPDGPLGDAAWAKQQLSRATQALPNGYCQLPLVKTCPHANSCFSEQSM